MSKCKYITLDNGLTVLIYIDKNKSCNYAEFVTFVGGSSNMEFISSNGDKCELLPGTAHLLEHYVYENSKFGNMRYAFRNNRVLNSNASTNNGKTSYYFDTVDNFKECLGILIEGVYNPIFSSDILEKTKYAVFNEIRDNEDNISSKIINTKVGNIFNYFNETLGTSDNIRNISVEYLKEVYNYFYVPKNQFLVVAGNFDENEIVDYIKDICNKYSFENNEKRQVFIDKKEVNKKEDIVDGDSLDEVIISFKIPTYDMNSFEKYEFDWYLGYFLENSFSLYSSINEKLKKDNIITGDINSALYRMNGYSIFEVLAFTDKKNVFTYEVLTVIKNYKSIKEEDFEFSKKLSKLNVSVRKDKISSYVFPVMDNYIEFDYKEDDTIEFVDSLNYDRFMEVIGKIDFSNYSILTVKGRK